MISGAETAQRKSYIVEIGVFEEDYTSEWSSPAFEIPKKN
jgi:hypothetical protein